MILLSLLLSSAARHHDFGGHSWISVWGLTTTLSLLYMVLCVYIYIHIYVYMHMVYNHAFNGQQLETRGWNPGIVALLSPRLPFEAQSSQGLGLFLDIPEPIKLGKRQSYKSSPATAVKAPTAVKGTISKLPVAVQTTFQIDVFGKRPYFPYLQGVAEVYAQRCRLCCACL